ncbi:MAG: hypothetical protein HY558_05170 [Euryarchaeota archaeon]|nr:hypothetical protein [Euryarchaeota archaeon]
MPGAIKVCEVCGGQMYDSPLWPHYGEHLRRGECTEEQARGALRRLFIMWSARYFDMVFEKRVLRREDQEHVQVE